MKEFIDNNKDLLSKEQNLIKDLNKDSGINKELLEKNKDLLNTELDLMKEFLKRNKHLI